MDPLRAIVRDALIEVAKGPKHAGGKGLALSITSAATEDFIVLYDPTKMFNAFVDLLNAKIDSGDQVVMRQLFRNFVQSGRVKQFVYGGMNIDDTEEGECYGAKEITLLRAEKGWGPMLYDIALAISPGGLTAGRRSVTGAAAKVWDYYLNKRSDVQALKFDDVKNPKTPPKEDDCMLHPAFRKSLNYAFRATGGGPNISSMKQRHESFLEDLIALDEFNEKGRGLSYEFVDDAFADITLAYFG